LSLGCFVSALEFDTFKSFLLDLEENTDSKQKGTQTEDCEREEEHLESCKQNAYDEYTEAVARGDDGKKPDWEARKTCIYLTENIEHCPALWQGCRNETELMTKQEESYFTILLRDISGAVPNWDSQKCPAVKHFINRLNDEVPEDEDEATEDDIPEHAAPSGKTTDLLLLDSTKTPKVLQLPSFTPLPGCSVPRYPLTVVNSVSGVQDGHVILCGGENYNSRVDEKACHMLKNGGWAREPSLQSARRYAAASLTRSGHMLVTGGLDGQSDTVHQTSELRDVTGLWVMGPLLPEPTYLHCQVTVDSDVYILGGSDQYRNYATAYKLEGNKWTPLPNMTIPRTTHACAVLNNSIYVIGGDDSTTSVERLDLSTMTWNTEPSISADLDFYGGQAVVYDSTIYIINWAGKVYKLYGEHDHVERVASLPQVGYRSTFPTPMVSAEDAGCIF